MSLVEVILYHTRAVHAATVACAARFHLFEGTVETVNFMPFLLRPFDKLFRKISGISVPAGTAGQYCYFHCAIVFSVQTSNGFHDAASQDNAPCSRKQGFAKKVPALHHLRCLSAFPSDVHGAISSPVRR